MYYSVQIVESDGQNKLAGLLPAHNDTRYCARNKKMFSLPDISRILLVYTNANAVNLISRATSTRILSAISINLLAFYHECRSLIGYATHYLFCDR